jgi:hypothetical protein
MYYFDVFREGGHVTKYRRFVGGLAGIRGTDMAVSEDGNDET